MVVDLRNTRFTRLTALRLVGSGKDGKVWACRCDCGTELEVKARYLRDGGTKSCGCLRDETNAKNARQKVTHGMYLSPTYRSWDHMIQRCANPNNDSYHRYGERGITVQPDWYDFANFLRDMGARPDDTTLERQNNDLGYTKDNCKWGTWLEQGNNKSSNRIVAHNGERRTLAEWSRIVEVSQQTIGRRLRDGWSIEEALTKDVTLNPHKRKK